MNIDLDETVTIATDLPSLLVAQQRHAEAVQAECAAQTAYQTARSGRKALASRLQSVRHQLRLASSDSTAATLTHEARDVQALVAALDAELAALHTTRAALSAALVTAHHALRAVQDEARRVWYRARASQIEEAQASQPWERIAAREAVEAAHQELAELVGADAAHALQDGRRPDWLVR